MRSVAACIAAIVATAQVVSVVGSPLAEAEALANAFPEAPLIARSCTYNGCRCKPGTKAGVYCGNCPAIEIAGGASYEDVFHCDGTKCCHYGPRDSCKGPHPKPCG